jgi:hypothetical protein
VSAPRFPVVDPSEKATLSFDFSAGLASGETLTAPTAVVTVDYGIDASPQAIVQGSPTVQGNLVLVAVANTRDQVDYHVRVTCTTSNSSKTLALAGVLPSRVL